MRLFDQSQRLNLRNNSVSLKISILNIKFTNKKKILVILILKSGSLLLLRHILNEAFCPCLTPFIFSLTTNISLFGNTLILIGKPSIIRPLLEQNIKCSTGSNGINFILSV